MNKTPVIAVFDAGKTNKKLFLFDEQYKIVFRESFQFPEIQDEDGFPSEDIGALRAWIRESMDRMTAIHDLEIKAVNFSAYGASFVHVNQEGEAIAPLYNYLKPFPEKLRLEFYEKYGGETEFSKCTASPVLGNLNSGLQLYRLKYEQPHLFIKIRYSLHLPQYLSSLLTRKAYSDITSIGCHTGLWDFGKNRYHDWVYRENISPVLAAIFPSYLSIPGIWNDHALIAGTGLHDSSAALIPYQLNHDEPFILLSTGTWCISLNPFNSTALRFEELALDCLCYMEYRGKQVKASRLFAGREHEDQVKRLALHFNKPADHYKTIGFDPGIISSLPAGPGLAAAPSKLGMIQGSAFGGRDLSAFEDYGVAYHQLILDLIRQQAGSTRLVIEGSTVKRIFVDGGFSQNPLYMHLLAIAFPQMQVFAATLSEASAMGAALALHPHWNKHALPSGLIEWKSYP